MDSAHADHDDGIVQLAQDDPLQLVDTRVSLPDRLWPECAGSSSSTSSTILGPLQTDRHRYAVLSDGFVYLFDIHALVTFLPASRRARIRAVLRRNL